jgi:hypothetical protein
MVAVWRKRVIAGTRRLTLLLPASARHPGKHRLRLTWADGTTARTLPLMFKESQLRASR